MSGVIVEFLLHFDPRTIMALVSLWNTRWDMAPSHAVWWVPGHGLGRVDAVEENPDDAAVKEASDHDGYQIQAHQVVQSIRYRYCIFRAYKDLAALTRLKDITHLGKYQYILSALLKSDCSWIK